MICPNCGAEKTRVLATNKSLFVVRFRKCEKCGTYFSTAELPITLKLPKDYENLISNLTKDEFVKRFKNAV